MTNLKTIKILLAGEGGQGIQTIAEALAYATELNGQKVTYIPSFGVEQRGTPSLAYIQISDQNLRYPRFNKADICLVLRERAIKKITTYITPNTKLIFDSSTMEKRDLPKISTQVFGTPATKYASEKFHPKSINVLAYGILIKLLEFNSEKSWNAIEEVLKSKFKDKKVWQLNYDAYLFGYNAVLEKSDFSEPVYKTKSKQNIIKGNSKIAEINPARCKGCGICIEICPVNALKFGPDLGVLALPVPEIDINKCIACDQCRRFCPDGAIGVDKVK